MGITEMNLIPLLTPLLSSIYISQEKLDLVSDSVACGKGPWHFIVPA